METIIVRRYDGEVEEINVEEVTLKLLQELVGGHIEFVPGSWLGFDDDLYLIINEEGKLLSLGPNIPMYNKNGEIIDILFGNVVCVVLQGEAFVGVNQVQQQKVMELFSRDYTMEIVKLFEKVLMR